MANVVEDDQITKGECEATVLLTPKDFFGNSNFEEGDWAQVKDRPEYIAGTADWAVYPTRHFTPSVGNLKTMLRIAMDHNITLGRNSEQIASLSDFLNEKIAIADIGDFDASTKPVPVNVLPYWWFVRSEKTELGENVTVKTLRLQTQEDLMRLQTASGALTQAMLRRDDGLMGVIDRIIIKYQLKVGESAEGNIYVPADLRVDRRYQLRFNNNVLSVSDPSYITSVECEVNPDGVDQDLLRRAMKKIYNTLCSRGGIKTAVRFGKYSLAEDPREYLRSVTPGVSDAEFGELYQRMQDVGEQVFEVYGRNPDSINQQVKPATKELMTELQKVHGRF